MPRRPPAVARVLERVTATAREHTMFNPGGVVLLAVSGGPDSTCLLHSLHMLRRLFRIDLEVFHFDHRLRPDSGKDAEYVRGTAQRLRVPFHLGVAEDSPRKGQSVEDWAHRARWKAMFQVGRQRRPVRYAWGHTLDDQVETVLLALLRGGGLESIAGMAPHRGMLLHPLIDVRREEVRAFNAALRLRPRVDPTNRDTRLMRNALRLKGIPALERAVGRSIAEPVARTASLLAIDVDYFRRAMTEHIAVQEIDASGARRLVAARLRELHPAVASRLVLAVLGAAIDGFAEASHVQAVLDLARGRPGRKVDLPGGLIARRERDYVVLSRSSPGDWPSSRDA